MAKLQSIINLLQDTTLGLTFTKENCMSIVIKQAGRKKRLTNG